MPETIDLLIREANFVDAEIVRQEAERRGWSMAEYLRRLLAREAHRLERAAERKAESEREK